MGFAKGSTHPTGLNQQLLAARANFAQGRKASVGKEERPTNSSSAIGTEGLRRRGSDAVVANLFLAGGLSVDASCLPVYVPWKIFNPHNTTTMADTSVAAVNTLSKEATLILLSASQPH
jgi:hypothetical protein